MTEKSAYGMSKCKTYSELRNKEDIWPNAQHVCDSLFNSIQFVQYDEFQV